MHHSLRAVRGSTRGDSYLRRLVDDGGVLLVPQVKHAHRAVGRHRGKDAHTAPRNVVHLSGKRRGGAR